MQPIHILDPVYIKECKDEITAGEITCPAWDVNGDDHNVKVKYEVRTDCHGDTTLNVMNIEKPEAKYGDLHYDIGLGLAAAEKKRFTKINWI